MATETFREFMSKGWSWGGGGGGGLSKDYIATLEDLRAIELQYPLFTEFSDEEKAYMLSRWTFPAIWACQVVKPGYTDWVKYELIMKKIPSTNSTYYIDDALGKEEADKAFILSEDGSSLIINKKGKALLDYTLQLMTEKLDEDGNPKYPNVSISKPIIQTYEEDEITYIWYYYKFLTDGSWWDLSSYIDTYFQNFVFSLDGFTSYQWEGDESCGYSTYEYSSLYDKDVWTMSYTGGTGSIGYNLYQAVLGTQELLPYDYGHLGLYDQTTNRPTTVGVAFNNAIAEHMNCYHELYGYDPNVTECGLYLVDISDTQKEIRIKYKCEPLMRTEITNWFKTFIIPNIDLSEIALIETPEAYTVNLGSSLTSEIETTISREGFTDAPDSYVTKWLNDYCAENADMNTILKNKLAANGYNVTQFKNVHYTCETQSGEHAYYVEFTAAGEEVEWDPSWLTSDEYDALDSCVAMNLTDLFEEMPDDEKGYVTICTVGTDGNVINDGTNTPMNYWFGGSTGQLGKSHAVTDYINTSTNELTLLGKNLYYGTLYITNQQSERYHFDYTVEPIVEPDPDMDRLVWTNSAGRTIIKLGLKKVAK